MSEKKMKVTSRNYLTAPPGTYSLGSGLIYCVRGNSRLWFYRYQAQGKRYHVPVGSAYDVTLTDARLRVSELAVKRARGVSIVEEKRALVKGAVPFAQYYEEILPRLKMANPAKAKTWNEKISKIRRFAFPVIGKKPIRQVSRNDILQIMDVMGHLSSGTIHKLRVDLEKVFAVAKIEGLITDNPCSWKNNLQLLAPPLPKVERHHPAISLEGLKELAPKLFSKNKTGEDLLLFLILTGTRSAEPRFMRFEDVDFETATWNIPADETKMARAHRVPLSRQALAILNRHRRERGIVFVSAWTGAEYGRSAMADVLERHTEEKASPHGMRSTLRDFLADNNVPFEVSERCLAHVERSTTVRAYLRNDLLEQRREAMQMWADDILPM